MTSRNHKLYLLDIIESIEAIQKHVFDVSVEEFSTNITVQDAVIRRLEVIGEAVKHLPEELLIQYTAIPWKEIAGMRDVFIHEYFGVNMQRVWNVIDNDLPALKEAVHDILRKI